eukprot:10146768-Alexandrium_andersonii.AAC.1
MSGQVAERGRSFREVTNYWRSTRSAICSCWRVTTCWSIRFQTVSVSFRLVRAMPEFTLLKAAGILVRPLESGSINDSGA